MSRPPMPIVSLPGLLFASAMSALRSPAGIFGLPTSRLGTVEIIAIGEKSATGSNGSLG